MTTPDDPTWTEQEIEQRANDLPPDVPPLPGLGEISQDPNLFAEEHTARFGSKWRAAVASGSAAAMIAAAVALLGMGEHPANHNPVTVEYNQKIARIGDGPWCDMGITVEALHSGNIDAVCGGMRRGFAYTPAHAQDFKHRGLWHAGLKGIKAGDVVFFNWSGHKSIDSIEHVGLVEHVYSDGTIATIECNISDACRREHRDSTYAVGYGRPPYNAQQQEDDVPEYVSLGMKQPKKVKAGAVVNAVFDDEYGDAGKAHADGPHPGIVSGGAKKTSFMLEADVTGAGSVRLVETDPKHDYKVTKTYPLKKIVSGEPVVWLGKIEPSQHLYLEFHPSADGTMNAAVKCHYWHL